MMNPILFRLVFAILFVFSIKLCFAAPVTGNPHGCVTLVEYFDYECPHCRRMESVIEQLEKQNPNLKVVHRVTPLLTPASRGVASFALAAQTENQWQAEHQRLMFLQEAPTLNDAKTIATQLGLNTQAMFNKMQTAAIQQQINQNIQLVEKHAVQGGIYLPVLVFRESNGRGQTITLTGEQPYQLLAAIVKQLGVQGGQYVQQEKTKQKQ
ncbi:MAG: hypothetical protein COV52_01960 [Gammaproteobacteria bacterium CG11_big_fil_rev_8_21_14_0_20_46_22]|nr:MAG: hypothetical protein COW05_05855 [Gammaproteobacteria bacterium CG12_big_fil_rev_8_21_14_0_65_46_12]PIR11880.1 MAG: hypothetical protein COV52_01960 [Gammaproteobacteria bacterium CG11_big_fil_rev_8_21_14_0_20_46_22]